MSDARRRHGMSSATFFKWKAMNSSLEDENAKLKKQLDEPEQRVIAKELK